MTYTKAVHTFLCIRRTPSCVYEESLRLCLHSDCLRSQNYESFIYLCVKPKQCFWGLVFRHCLQNEFRVFYYSPEINSFTSGPALLSQMSASLTVYAESTMDVFSPSHSLARILARMVRTMAPAGTSRSFLVCVFFYFVLVHLDFSGIFSFPYNIWIYGCRECCIPSGRTRR